MHGFIFRPMLKTALITFSSPAWHYCHSSAVDIAIIMNPNCLASPLANNVFAVPGGPWRITPVILFPLRTPWLKASGYFKVRPVTSSKRFFTPSFDEDVLVVWRDVICFLYQRNARTVCDADMPLSMLTMHSRSMFSNRLVTIGLHLLIFFGCSRATWLSLPTMRVQITVVSSKPQGFASGHCLERCNCSFCWRGRLGTFGCQYVQQPGRRGGGM